jgi:methionine synthase I (cobalamin-dependent)
VFSRWTCTIIRSTAPRRGLLRRRNRSAALSYKMAPRRLILDGSMGHTLKQRGLSDSFAEAAYANLRQPELVTSVHSEVSATPSESGTDTHY